MVVRNLPHAGVVVVASVGRGTCHQQLGPIEGRVGLQKVVIDNARGLVQSVWEALRASNS